MVFQVADPQPPFGIPLGPITTAQDSDYLHSNPTTSPQLRSPYIPNRDPDLVTDDLAYRALRKDTSGAATGSSRQSSPSFYSPVPTPSPLPQNNWRRKRSLSSSLYGIINPSPRRILSDFDDEEFFDKRNALLANGHNRHENELKSISCSDLDLSGRSCEEEEDSIDGRIIKAPVEKVIVVQVVDRDNG